MVEGTRRKKRERNEACFSCREEGKEEEQEKEEEKGKKGAGEGRTKDMERRVWSKRRERESEEN